MSESAGPNPQEQENTLSLYTKTVLDNGDIVYKPPSLTGLSSIHCSPQGETLLLGRAAQVMPLLREPLPSKVVRRNVGTRRNQYTVAVKEIKSDTDLSGTESFQIIRSLQSAGVVCAEPLVATDIRYVSSWVVGKNADIQDPEFQRYLRSLLDIKEQLKTEGVWRDTWSIDFFPGNFLQVPVEEGQKQFVAVDPIAVASTPDLALRNEAELKRVLGITS